MRTLICICWIMTSMLTHAQHTNFNSQRNWSLNKKAIFIGGGVTQFNGDLGGRNKLSSDHKIKDLNWPSTGWTSMAAYRYRFHPYWATTSKIQIGQLQGNDALKIDTYQNSRNLHFKSSFVEVSQRLEMILFVNERIAHRYAVSRRPDLFFQFYCYAGLGLVYYNPQANYQGNWIDLQSLRTEGQDLEGGSKPYKRVTASIPMGVGYRWNLSRFWKMGIELDYTFTFSDYLDDVGGNYFDANILAAEVGEASANLSNPSIQNTEWFTPGQARGDNRRDGFFSFSLLLSRNITYRNCRTKQSGVPEDPSEDDEERK